ncbi:MAG: HNH endonuclease [Agathobacter sp.]
MNKEIRKKVYNKYNGHCAYCGCEIEMKDMQVDHIIPKYRNNERWHKVIGSDEIDNLNPSCMMCNFYKGMFTVEQFREKLNTILMPNVRLPFNYRLALKYGLVNEDVKPIRFYFEKYENNRRKSNEHCKRV